MLSYFARTVSHTAPDTDQHRFFPFVKHGLCRTDLQTGTAVPAPDRTIGMTSPRTKLTVGKIHQNSTSATNGAWSEASVRGTVTESTLNSFDTKM